MNRDRVVVLLVAALLALPAVISRADIKDTLYFTTRQAGKVPFEHETHLKHLENNCSAFHNSLFRVPRKKNPPYTLPGMEEGKFRGARQNKQRPRTPQLSACTACHP